MLLKIKLFEKECFSNNLIEVARDIQNMPNIDISEMSIEEAEEAIRTRETNIMQQLLHRKTMAFIDVSYLLRKSYRELTDFKLVILDDFYISNRALDQR